MRIFLAYSSRDGDVAEALAVALRAENHTVFFDRQSLVRGHAYNGTIRKEIARSDLFIILVSDHSMDAQSYALTELGFAEKRWPDPSGKVLPVILDDTPIDDLPPYLRAVTVSRPPGNVIAQTVADVAALKRLSISRWLKIGLPAAISIALAVSAYFGSGITPQEFALVINQVKAGQRGFLERGDSYELSGSIRNFTAENEYLTALVVETRDPETSAELTDYLGEQTQLEISRNAPAPWSGQVRFKRAGIGLNHEAVRDLQWRVCAELVSQKICSDYHSGTGDAVFDSPVPKTLPKSLGARMRAVVSTSVGFAAALVEPNQIALLGPDASLIATQDLDAEPVSLAAENERVAVAMRFPDSVAITSMNSDRIERQFAVPVLSVTADGHTTSFSTRPKSIALLNGDVWLTVAGGEGEDGLLLNPQVTRQWRAHPAVDGFNIDPGDWVLRAGLNHVWAAAAETTPHYLYRLGIDELVEGSGHDNDDIQCASAILPLTGSAGLLSCDLQLLTATVNDEKFNINGRLFRLSVPAYLRETAQSYTEQWLSGREDRLIVAISALAVGGNDILGSAIYANDQVLFAHRRYRVIGLASFKNTVIALLVNDEGNHLALLF